MQKEALVSCCSLDGTSCSRTSPQGKCLSESTKVTWKEAHETCKKRKMRLCNSQKEMDLCCNGGCDYDDRLMWSNLVEGKPFKNLKKDIFLNSYKSEIITTNLVF